MKHEEEMKQVLGLIRDMKAGRSYEFIRSEGYGDGKDVPRIEWYVTEIEGLLNRITDGNYGSEEEELLSQLYLCMDDLATGRYLERNPGYMNTTSKAAIAEKLFLEYCMERVSMEEPQNNV